jgi:hypothetical protein
MKQIRVSFEMISATVLLALTVGCATSQTSTQSKESMLLAAGFKTITPKTTAHQQKLQKLPPGKVTMVNKAGKTYYIFPDPVQNRAYVGGPKCTRMKRWTGMHGVGGEQAGDQWE